MPRYTQNKISEFQKVFSATETFKRNKIHCDVIQLTAKQKRNCLRRRLPRQNTNLSAKIQNEFNCSQDRLTGIVYREIQKHKLRQSFSTNAQETNDSFNSSSNYVQKIKGVSLQKSLSREQLVKNNKNVSDQRLFNNFAIVNHSLAHTPSLRNYSKRSKDIQLKHINDLTYDYTKGFNKLHYDSKGEKCIFDLKLQNEQKERYFFIKKRKEDECNVLLSQQNFAKSFNLVSNFKENKAVRFYRLSDRNNPCQFDQRNLSPNCDFYRDRNSKIIKIDKEHTVGQRKEDMLQIEKKLYAATKQCQIKKEEMCQQLYFRKRQRRSSHQ